jgi:hypothetical protein
MRKNSFAPFPVASRSITHASVSTARNTPLCGAEDTWKCLSENCKFRMQEVNCEACRKILEDAPEAA